MNNYYIKNNYKCNLEDKGKNIVYLDNEKDSLIFQYEVYKFAQELIKKYNLKNVLDIGCGVGAKLNKLIYPVCKNIVGIDQKYAIDFCKKKYSFGQWYFDDVENPVLELDKKFELIISSDVIEHLVDPDNLLNYIRKYADKDTFIILSTPERDLVRGKKSYGPPLNISHVREWNMIEFKKYIKSKKFNILNHFFN